MTRAAAATKLYRDALADATDAAERRIEVERQTAQSAQASIKVTNIGRTKQTVRWSATPESGLDISPTKGSIVVAGNSSASVPVTVTAASSSEGRYSISVDFSLASGLTLSSSSVSVAVAKPGEVWPYYTNAGITDDSNTDAASFDGGGWSYSWWASPG